MTDDKSKDQSNDKSNNRWAIILGAIGLLAIALLLWRPFPPWLRVVAVMLAILAVLWGLGILPRLRAAWRRSLSDLPSDAQRNARWKRAFGLIGVLAVALSPPATVAATVQDHRGGSCRIRSLGGAWRTSRFASHVAALARRPDHHVRRHPCASLLWSDSTAWFLARRRRPNWSFEADLGLVSTDPVAGSGLA